MCIINTCSVIPVIISGCDETGDVAEDPPTALDDGQGIGLAPVGESADQEAQSPIYRADGHLIFLAVSRQVPQRTEDALQGGLLQNQTGGRE